MQRFGSLGTVNAAFVAAYFVAAWGREALQSLNSRFYGLEHDATLTAAIFYRRMVEQSPGDLTAAAAVLIGIKLVIVSVFATALVSYAHAALAGRKSDHEMIDSALILAVAGIIVWILPALATGDTETIRLCATQFLLIAGAAIVLLTEREDEPQAADARTLKDMVREAARRRLGRVSALLRLDRLLTHRAHR
jgi:hypothetical protein